MSSCLGLYIESNVIKYAKVTKEDVYKRQDHFDVEKYGKAIEYKTDLFPNKTNVEFIQIVDKNHVKMRVWESGAGETLACGTGACATAVACYRCV